MLLCLSMSLSVLSAESRPETGSSSARPAAPVQQDRSLPEGPIQPEPTGLRPSAVQCVYPLLITADNRSCAVAPNRSPGSQAGHQPGEILLLVASDALLAVKTGVERQGYRLVEQRSLPQLQQSLLVISTDRQPLEAVIQQLRRQFPFAEVDRNDHYQAAEEPRLYANEKINWQSFTNCPLMISAPIKVGMIDGAIDLDHPSLVGQTIRQQSFYREQPSPDKDHATAIAVLLVGNTQTPALTGLLTDVELVAAAVLEQFEFGAVATTDAIALALDWLMANQVRLINISLSGSRQNRVLNKLLDLSTRQGLLIFAAAGNDKQQHTAAFPAAHPQVFAITAIDAANRIYPLANQGEYLDFSAPGVDIWTASRDGSGRYRSGTSFAVPYAVAAAASYLKLNPNLSRNLLHQTLQRYSEDLGIPGHDSIFGWGLIKLPESLCQR